MHTIACCSWISPLIHMLTVPTVCVREFAFRFSCRSTMETLPLAVKPCRSLRAAAMSKLVLCASHSPLTARPTRSVFGVCMRSPTSTSGGVKLSCSRRRLTRWRTDYKPSDEGISIHGSTNSHSFLAAWCMRKPATNIIARRWVCRDPTRLRASRLGELARYERRQRTTARVTRQTGIRPVAVNGLWGCYSRKNGNCSPHPGPPLPGAYPYPHLGRAGPRSDVPGTDRAAAGPRALSGPCRGRAGNRCRRAASVWRSRQG